MIVIIIADCSQIIQPPHEHTKEENRIQYTD